jgi:hypothetical protein
VDGLERAFQLQSVAQFPEGEIRLLAQQGVHLALMAGDDPRFAPGQVMAMRDGAGVAALLEQLFDHAQRHPEASSDIFSGSLLGIISGQDSFP